MRAQKQEHMHACMHAYTWTAHARTHACTHAHTHTNASDNRHYCMYCCDMQLLVSRKNATVLHAGDISVGGLPFRSAELTPSTLTFGAKTSMLLYPGEWELRLVFGGFAWRPKNFEWTGVLNKNGFVDISFPAVGGNICVFASDGPLRTQEWKTDQKKIKIRVDASW